MSLHLTDTVMKAFHKLADPNFQKQYFQIIFSKTAKSFKKTCGEIKF